MHGGGQGPLARLRQRDQVAGTYVARQGMDAVEWRQRRRRRRKKKNETGETGDWENETRGKGMDGAVDVDAIS